MMPGSRHGLALALSCALAGTAAEGQSQAVAPAACEPRSTAAPGRLNIDSRAERYGLVAPCEAALILYIARNTSLRALSVTVRASDPDGTPRLQQDIRLELDRGETGMLATQHPLPSLPDLRCLDLAVVLRITGCRDGDGAAVGCPDIRLLQSPVFGRLSVLADGPAICEDERSPAD